MDIKNTLKIFNPAIAFTAILSGGGYITGREITEYFYKFGNQGYYAIFVVAILFGFISYFSIEVSRKNRVFTYDKWSYIFLGKYFFLLDIIFSVLAVIAIAVVISGSIVSLKNSFEINEFFSLLILLLIFSILVLYGEKVIFKYKLFGTISLILFFIVTFIFVYKKVSYNPFEYANENIYLSFFSGIKYAAYNSIVFPAILYTFKEIETKRQSVLSSILLALVGIFPILFSFWILSSGGSETLKQDLPILYIILNFCPNWLKFFFNAIILYTLIDTAIGLIQSIMQRIDSSYSLKSKFIKIILTIAIILVSYFLSIFGIINLVAKGYGTMSYLFILILIIPLLIYNVKKNKAT